MKFTLKGKSFSALASLAGAVIAIIAMIAFCIYGAVYAQYEDAGVAIFLLLGALASLSYTFADTKITEFGSLVGTFCVSFAMGLFVVNSYNVWADWYGNFHMYNSEGGVVRVILLLILYIVAIICNIVSCFTKKGREAEA